MAVLRLFAAARTAAGTARDLVPGDTVAEILASATERYGDGFAAVLPSCAVWVNGDRLVSVGRLTVHPHRAAGQDRG